MFNALGMVVSKREIIYRKGIPSDLIQIPAVTWRTGGWDQLAMNHEMRSLNTV